MRIVYLFQLYNRTNLETPFLWLSFSEFILGELHKDYHHVHTMEGQQIKEKTQCSYN